MDEIETHAVATLVAPHPLAAAAGRDVLVEGGSVIEAAIAAAAVSAVVVPERNGLGGDALWILREPGPRGRVRVLDARGRVGRGATPALYGGHDVVPPHGPEAVLTVPGAAAGWAAAHELAGALGGRLALSRLLAPALAAAREGFDVTTGLAAALTIMAPALSDRPGFAPMFLPGGKVPDAGARLRCDALAAALEFLIHDGLEALYRGDVGRELGADLAEMSCPLTREDLRGGEARWRPPASLDLGRRRLEVVANRAGLGLAVVFGLFDGLRDMRPDGFDHWHGLIEAAARADRLIEAALAAEARPADLLDAEQLGHESLRIDRDRASAAQSQVAPRLAEDGVWIGAIDRDGGAVSLVQTLGGAFGSGVVSRHTGILLGNRGAALALDPRLGPLLEPGRRVPILSVPAILTLRDGRVASLGSTGTGASTALLQVATRIAMGTPAAEALAAPRFRRGGAPGEPDAAVLVGDDADSGLLARLRAAGHRIERSAEPPRTAGFASRRADARVEAGTDGAAAGVHTGL